MSPLERRLYTVAAGLFGVISVVMAVGLFLGEGDPGHSRALQAVQGLLLFLAGAVAFFIAYRLGTGQSLRGRD
jgi:uncharacterized membrane protein